MGDSTAATVSAPRTSTCQEFPQKSQRTAHDAPELAPKTPKTPITDRIYPYACQCIKCSAAAAGQAAPPVAAVAARQAAPPTAAIDARKAAPPMQQKASPSRDFVRTKSCPARWASKCLNARAHRMMNMRMCGFLISEPWCQWTVHTLAH